MKISIITLFPEVFKPYINTSILKRAQEKGLLTIELVDLRQFGEGRHQVVDDRPYGGGAGMVLKADVLAKAVVSCLDHAKDKKNSGKSRVLLTAASGKKFNQRIANQLALMEQLVIICGHYEGVDARFIENYVDEELTIGDYVLTGGELPAMIITDSITRLIKGVLKKDEAIQKESFSEGLLEHPHYTRPEIFEGSKVPEVLLSGDHKKIEDWREKESLKKTKKNRPELVKGVVSINSLKVD